MTQFKILDGSGDFIKHLAQEYADGWKFSFTIDTRIVLEKKEKISAASASS